MSSPFWLTIAVEAHDEGDARRLASLIASEHSGRVVQVDHEPPQGSTVVGDMHEDAL